MKRMFLAAAILAALALPQPSMAAEGCVAGDKAHNETIMLKILAAGQVLRPLAKEASADLVKNPSDENRERADQILGLLREMLEMNLQCQKIMKAGEPT